MSHKKYRTETNCLNCGTEVSGKFCSNCGQENLETRENFLHLAGHFVSDYFHWDSKFFRSLKFLFTKPGFLTKEYWQGRRVHYIHPLRLFFFITIIFMIAATYFYQRLEGRVKKSFVTTTVELSHADSVRLNYDSGAMKAEIQRQSTKAENEASTRYLGGLDNFFHDLKYVSFFLLPVYAFVFKLLFIRRKSFYVDHLVYTVHLQSFAYILITVAFLLALLFPDFLKPIRLTCVFTVLLYIVVSLRVLYQQKWWKTILKSLIATFLLFTVTGTVLGIYLAVYAVSHR